MDTIYGIFKDIDSADRALTKFAALNYNPQDISVILEEETSKKYQTVKGAGTGVAVGGLLGGIAALLLGAGAITITGLSPLLVAGPLALALGISGTAAAAAEGAAAGAVGGGLIGALVGRGIPKETAEAYETGIKAGKILLGVPVKTGMDENIVRKIFTDESAEQVYSLIE